MPPADGLPEIHAILQRMRDTQARDPLPDWPVRAARLRKLESLLQDQRAAIAAAIHADFGNRPVEVDHKDIPTAVFCQPEVGTVGLTETEARASFSHVDIYKAVFRPIKATMSGRDTRILMKLVVDGTSDRVVGCHIVGDTAAEIV